MERNTETLSTRDLASPNEQVGDVTTSRDDVRDTAPPERQPEVYDQAASAAEGTRVPADERTAPPGEARAAGSATDQTVEAGPSAGRPRHREQRPRLCGRGQADQLDTGRFDAGSRHRDSALFDGRGGLHLERRVAASGRHGRHVPTKVGGDPDPVRRRAPGGSRGRRQLGGEPHAAARRGLRQGTGTARSTMGPWRGHLHRGPARRPAALSDLLPASTVD